jgi:AraC-like DNA-binding protein
MVDAQVILTLAISLLLILQSIRLWRLTDPSSENSRETNPEKIPDARFSIKQLAVIGFISLFCLQTLLLAATLTNTLTYTTVIRPFLAALIPPMCFWMVLVLARTKAVCQWHDLVHLLPFALNSLQFISIDYALVMIQVLYALSLFRLVFDVRLSHRGPLKITTLFFAFIFLFIGAMDLVIAFEIRRGTDLEESLTLFISLFVIYSLLLVGVVVAYLNPSAIYKQLSDVQFATNNVMTGTPVKAHLDLMAEFKKIHQSLLKNEYFTEEDFDLGYLAQKLDMPVRKVSQIINQVTKKNFSTFINDLKVNKAQSLLRESETMPVTHVMLDSGFFTKSSFNREFSRRVGISPSNYRKNLKSPEAIIEFNKY